MSTQKIFNLADKRKEKMNETASNLERIISFKEQESKEKRMRACFTNYLDSPVSKDNTSDGS